MLCDKWLNIRKSAVTRILKRNESSQEGIRKFIISPLNFQLKIMFTLLAGVKLPSLIASLLWQCQWLAKCWSIHKKRCDSLFLTKYMFHLLCHTQAVERCVKEVTATPRQAYYSQSSDGIILSWLKLKTRVNVYN